MANIERIVKVRKGQRMREDGRVYTFSEPCSNLTAGHWYCLTHAEHFDTAFEKDSHIRQGDHVMGWICAEHGPEVP